MIIPVINYLPIYEAIRQYNPIAKEMGFGEGSILLLFTYDKTDEKQNTFSGLTPIKKGLFYDKYETESNILYKANQLKSMIFIVGTALLLLIFSPIVYYCIPSISFSQLLIYQLIIFTVFTGLVYLFEVYPIKKSSELVFEEGSLIETYYIAEKK